MMVLTITLLGNLNFYLFIEIWYIKNWIVPTSRWIIITSHFVFEENNVTYDDNYITFDDNKLSEYYTQKKKNEYWRITYENGEII